MLFVAVQSRPKRAILCDRNYVRSAVKIPRVHPKNGRWYYVRDLEDRSEKTRRPKQQWVKLTKIDEGEPALLEALKKLLTEPEQDAGGNFQTWAAEFLKIKLPSLTPNVREEYRRMYKVICAAFADFDVDEVEPGDILDFVAEWDDKPTSRKAYKARLSTFFSYCVLHTGKTGVIANPCREVTVQAPPKRRGRFTPEIYWKIHDNLSDVGQCFMDLMYLTRQRPTEIRLLKESAILPTHIHFAPTKTEDTSGEIVDVVRTPEIDAVIDRARRLQKVRAVGRGDAFLIQSEDGGGFTRWGIRSAWDRACAKAGIKGVTTRDVRPYALAAMEDMGADMREIQRAAAHADMATTEGYLEQYRSRLVDVRMSLPAKQNVGNA